MEVWLHACMHRLHRCMGVCHVWMYGCMDAWMYVWGHGRMDV